MTDEHDTMQFNGPSTPIKGTATELIETFQPDANENEVPLVQSPLAFENELVALLKRYFPQRASILIKQIGMKLMEDLSREISRTLSGKNHEAAEVPLQK